jgi:hypothetical protein
MEEIRPGALIRVSWIEDPDADAEWGAHIFDLSDDDSNVVMLIEWMPYIHNSKNVITFKCLWEDKVYYSSTNALLEKVKP